jgi:NAD(P)-dependent dehydrogenase (short-subunit alcohol dehydrogenase family)
MRYQLQDKIAVVTGAASGIGRAVAQRLAERGCRLALADINEKGLQETAATLPTTPLLQVLDVSDRAAVEAFAARVVAHFGTAHIIVNNAGVDVAQNISALEYADFEWLMGINFWGVVYGTKSFLPTLLAQKDGVIVNISSVLGFIGTPTQGAYCSAKFAVRGFTECLQQELADTGVRAVRVHPGGVKTDIVRSARLYEVEGKDVNREEMIKRFDKIAVTSPEKAAETIVNGIERGKTRVLVGPDARLIELIQRLAPVRYSKLLARLTSPPKKK